MALPISYVARTAAYAFLSNSGSGFNQVMNDNASQFGVAPFSINFATNSRNFFQGYYAAKDLIGTSIVTLPSMTLYTIRSQNQNIDKFNVFSGPILIGIDTFVSFPQSAALSNSDVLVDAVESSMYMIFNLPDNQAQWVTSRGNCTYAGDISVQRGPVLMGGPNWIQLVQTRIEVTVNQIASFDIQTNQN